MGVHKRAPETPTCRGVRENPLPENFKILKLGNAIFIIQFVIFCLKSEERVDAIHYQRFFGVIYPLIRQLISLSLVTVAKIAVAPTNGILQNDNIKFYYSRLVMSFR